MDQDKQKNSKTADLIFKGLATFGFMVLLAALVWGGIIVAKKANPALNSMTNVVATVLTFGNNNETETNSSGTQSTTTGTTGTPVTPVVTKPTNTSTGTSHPVTTLTPGVKTETSYTYGESNVPTLDPKGLPDLVPSIVAVGYMNDNNEFVADDAPSIAFQRKMAVKFIVENKGVNSTGDWRMNVVIPTQPNHIFSSDMIRNLNPGEKIEFVIAFTKPKTGAVEVIVNADPTCTDTWCSGSVKESNEKNNILKYSYTIKPAA